MCMAMKDLIENMKKEKGSEVRSPVKEWEVEKSHHSIQEPKCQKKQLSEYSA